MSLSYQLEILWYQVSPVAIKPLRIPAIYLGGTYAIFGVGRLSDSSNFLR